MCCVLWCVCRMVRKARTCGDKQFDSDSNEDDDNSDADDVKAAVGYANSPPSAVTPTGSAAAAGNDGPRDGTASGPSIGQQDAQPAVGAKQGLRRASGEAGARVTLAPGMSPSSAPTPGPTHNSPSPGHGCESDEMAGLRTGFGIGLRPQGAVWPPESPAPDAAVMGQTVGRDDGDTADRAGAIRSATAEDVVSQPGPRTHGAALETGDSRSACSARRPRSNTADPDAAREESVMAANGARNNRYAHNALQHNQQLKHASWPCSCSHGLMGHPAQRPCV